MSDSRGQICEAERFAAMVSFETKLSVVPGRKWDGQWIADCIVGLWIRGIGWSDIGREQLRFRSRKLTI